MKDRWTAGGRWAISSSAPGSERTAPSTTFRTARLGLVDLAPKGRVRFGRRHRSNAAQKARVSGFVKNLPQSGVDYPENPRRENRNCFQPGAHPCSSASRVITKGDSF